MPVNESTNWGMIFYRVRILCISSITKRVGWIQKVLENDLLEIVIRCIGEGYIPNQANNVQKYTLRCTTVQQFVEDLNDLTCCLLFFH
jgi:hypothetical protein